MALPDENSVYCNNCESYNIERSGEVFCDECVEETKKEEYKRGLEDGVVHWQKSIEEDINSVLSMVEGGESRDKIANYIKEYLLS